MHTLKASIGAAITFGALLLSPATAAMADDGDGNRVCNAYEICFRLSDASDFAINGNWMHTFWYSNKQHDQNWLYGPDWTAPSIILMDNANGFWNRDSSCDVKLWDVTSSGTWHLYADLPRGYLGNAGYNINNGHTRC